MREIDKQDTPGLGQPRPRETPKDNRPEWIPTGTPHIERHRDTGHLRNTKPEPPPEIPPFPYFGCPRTWGTVIENLRRAAG